MNLTECGWPDRDWKLIWSSPGFKYPDIILRPMWLFICTVGNILNIYLLSRNKNFQATFLTCVSVYDMTYMWSWISLWIRDRVGAANIHATASWATLVFLEFVGNVTAQCSDWTLVVFTVTRVICLVDPFGIAPLLTQTLARILITILTILAVPTNLYSIFEYATQGKPAAKSWITKWRDLQDLASIVVPLLTFAIMFTLNMAIVFILFHRKVVKNSDQGKEIGADSRRFSLSIQENDRKLAVRSRGKDKKIAATMHLLTASVILYLISRIPFVIWQIIMQLEKHCIYHLNDNQSIIFLPFYYQFLYANYSINFLIYCGVSRVYWLKVWWMVAHCSPMPRKPPEHRGENDDEKDEDFQEDETKLWSVPESVSPSPSPKIRRPKLPHVFTASSSIKEELGL